MKRLIILVLLLVTIQLLSKAQSRKNSNEPFIYASTNLNVTPPVESYSFFSTITRAQDLYLLKFLTPTSGTFVIAEADFINLERENVNIFPSQLISLGQVYRLSMKMLCFMNFH